MEQVARDGEGMTSEWRTGTRGGGRGCLALEKLPLRGPGKPVRGSSRSPGQGVGEGESRGWLLAVWNLQELQTGP